MLKTYLKKDKQKIEFLFYNEKQGKKKKKF